MSATPTASTKGPSDAELLLMLDILTINQRPLDTEGVNVAVSREGLDYVSRGLRERLSSPAVEKLAGADEFREAASVALASIDSLISESAGVAGFHKNGDVAPWEEILDDGRYQCLELAPLRDALAKAYGGPTAAAAFAHLGGERVSEEGRNDLLEDAQRWRAPMSDEDDCDLCDGTGEVEIAPHGDLTKQDCFGCPLCMSKEFAIERAAISSSRAEVETLRAALEEQHKWHLDYGVQDPELNGIDMSAEYSDSGMCERTIAALASTPEAANG